MLSILDAFGIKDQSILKDKDRLAKFLQLDASKSNDNTKALISTVVTLVDVVYSIQKQLEDNKVVKKSIGFNKAAYKNHEHFADTDENDESSEDDDGDDSDSDSDDSGSSDSGSGSSSSVSDEEEDCGSERDGSIANVDTVKTAEKSTTTAEDKEGAVDTGLPAPIEEDDSTDGFEYDDVIMNSGDNEEDLDDNLDSIFDDMTTSDSTTHPIPTNFTYNYKPQQTTTMKIPANISANQRTGRTVTVVNWTDVPLSQIAMKYNVSKSVIGPTLQVLRDFEKKNNKAFQEMIKKNKIASEERQLKLSQLKDEPDIAKVPVKNGKITATPPVTKQRKRVTKSPSKSVSPGPVKDKKSVSDSHKVRLRLRNKRKNGDDSGNKDDESSSESVYDPNYRSDDDKKKENKEEGEVLTKEKEVSKRKSEDSNTTSNGEKTNNNTNGHVKRVKFNDPITTSLEDPQLSNSLYTLLQKNGNSTEEPKLLIQSNDSELVDTMRSNSKEFESNIEIDDTNKSDDQVPSFAYSLTSNGQYQCKSNGCTAKPFSQYIQLYKHKSMQHPQELPS